jgi:hypothetical protein
MLYRPRAGFSSPGRRGWGSWREAPALVEGSDAKGA